MNSDLYSGKLVRLAIFDPGRDAAILARWGRDSEFQRLLDDSPASLRSPEIFKDQFEKEPQDEILFAIHTQEDDRNIGLIGLSRPDLAGNSWVSIGIGDRQDWGKGYGTEAMRLAVDFGFREWNLGRISLNVFEYNPRAIRSYEKAGFRHEGRQRQILLRDGRRWDIIFMGILRSEWQQISESSSLSSMV